MQPTGGGDAVMRGGQSESAGRAAGSKGLPSCHCQVFGSDPGISWICHHKRLVDIQMQDELGLGHGPEDCTQGAKLLALECNQFS
mmetsp:Transcript_128630/g.222207  ORF Transcript_128630/g.222207 Transcript_128630/m.222207 type:complete len:85 (-) Transcript_128630:9-263(-)